MNCFPPTHHDERLLVLEEAALLAHVSVGTVRRWINAGLPSYGTGRILIRPCDLMAHLQRPHKMKSKASPSVPPLQDAPECEPATIMTTTTTPAMPNKEDGLFVAEAGPGVYASGRS
jgi:hypothetical protein